MKVLISLTDVEPAVRLNAQLERDGVETAVVSPLDDVRGAIRREKPDVIAMTGALVDPQNVALVREMLWEGVAVVGLADVRDAEIDERLKAMKPRVAYPLPNTLTGEGNFSVDITFESKDDFSPAANARNVGALNELLKARQQLANLVTYMDGKAGAEDLIGKVLKDPALLNWLAAAPKEGEAGQAEPPKEDK